MVKDTTPPVIEGIRNGWRYGLYDTSDGQLGTRSFTVRDPEQDKEVSSGIKSVTVNGVEQTGPDYVLTAPETNGENGLSCEIVATDNAGNSSSMRVELYRYNRVQFFHTRDDPSSRFFGPGVLHNDTFKFPFKNLPKEAYFVDLDNEDIKIYHEEGEDFNFGVINRNRRFLQVIPKTELPTLELGLRSRRFWGYHADSEGEFIYADMPSRTEKGYRMDIRLTSDEDSYYYGSPESYTLEQLKALDAEG